MKKTEDSPMLRAIKGIRLNASLAALAYLILGFVLLLLPNTSKRVLCTLVGVGVTAYGLFSILSFLLDRDLGGLSIELVIGVAALAFGLFSLLNSSFLMDFLIISLGLVIAVSSVSSIKRALNLKSFGYRYWWISLAVAIVTLIVALTFVFCPGVYGDLLMRIIGGILIVESVGDLLTIHRLSKLARDVKATYTIR